MIRFRNLAPLAAILAGAAILGMPPPAQATFKLTVAEVGGPSYTIVDNGAGDINSNVGQIMYFGSVGDFTIQMDIGSSNSAAGVQPAQLNINSSSITSSGFSGDRTLMITLEDDGFTAPEAGQQAGMVSQLSAIGLPTNVGVTFQSFINGSAGTLLSLDSTVSATSHADTVIIPGSPYQLTNVTTLTVHGTGTGNWLNISTAGLTSVAVPTPPGAVLALAGLPFAGFGCWLRRRKKA